MTVTDLPTQRQNVEPTTDPQAEQAVLGAALLNAAVIPDIQQTGLTAATLATQRHATIWQAITDLAAGGTPVDPIAVHAELQRRKLDTKTGGAPYLHTLMQAVPTTASATWYAQRLVTLAAKRRVETLGHRLIQIAREPTSGREDVFDAATAAMGEVSHTIEDLEPSSTAKTISSWADIDLTQAIQGGALHDPPTVLARDDGPCLIYPGKVHTFSGESESAKTWLLLQACAQQIAAGHHVIYLDFEDNENAVTARMLAIGARPQHILDCFHYRRPVDPLDAAGRASFDTVLPQQPTLAVIDGVTEAMHLHGLDPLSNTDVVAFYATLARWLAARGPAVALIDHVVKDQEARGRYGLGGVHKLNGLDGAAYTIRPIRPFGIGQHGISRVEIAKDRPGRVREHQHGAGHIADMHLWSETHGVRIEIRPPRPYDEHAGGGFRPTHLMEKVSRYVEAHPNISKNGIETAVRGKAEHVRLALELLITETYISVEKGQRGAFLHRVERPFREVPDDDGAM